MKKPLLLLLLFGNNVFAQTTCDTKQLPIVLVHGFMGSGDNWSTQVQRFSSRGFCEDRIFVFDWNTIGGKQNTDSLLNSFIDAILKKTGSTQINLAGHSAGGGLCYRYLNDSLHALKVAHYVHIGSMKMKAPAGKHGEVPTMNIYSADDQVMKNGTDIAGAVNVKQTGHDHMQVASSEATFANMYSFFTGSKELVSTNIAPLKQTTRIMAGRGVIMAENTPMAFDSFRVNIIDPKTGQRIGYKSNTPGNAYVGWNQLDKEGHFSFELGKGNYTEFEVRPKGGRRLFYYFEPLPRNNKNIYLRGLPTAGMAANMLGTIPNDSTQSVLVIFTSNNAVIAGRDSLAIDSIPLSLPSLMPASKTSIATFLFDDGDGISSGKALKSMSMAPFITGVDIMLKAEKHSSMRVYYNGRTIVLPKIKSNEGIMILVLN